MACGRFGRRFDYRRSGLSPFPFQCVVVLTNRNIQEFGVVVLDFRRFGLSPFRVVVVLTCRRFGRLK